MLLFSASEMLIPIVKNPCLFFQNGSEFIYRKRREVMTKELRERWLSFDEDGPRFANGFEVPF